jgi:hypothetical protein
MTEEAEKGNEEQPKHPEKTRHKRRDKTITIHDSPSTR